MDYSTLADANIAKATQEALTAKGYNTILVKTGEEALTKIKEIIPAGASVMNGSSTTLNQIGFVDYLKAGEHGWDNLHDGILAEPDMHKQGLLRRQSTLSDYYLGSVHALTQTGEMVIASNTGSQLPHIAYTSPNLIFVVSTKKIVPDINTAMDRIDDYVVPLENDRMLKAMNVPTALNKLLIVKGEAAFLGRKINVILVEEDLGF